MSNRVWLTWLVISNLTPSATRSTPFLLHVISDGGWLSIMASRKTSLPCSAIFPCGADTKRGAISFRVCFDITFLSTTDFWDVSLTKLEPLWWLYKPRSKNEVCCGSSETLQVELLTSLTRWLCCPSSLWYSSVRNDSDCKHYFFFFFLTIINIFKNQSNQGFVLTCSGALSPYCLLCFSDCKLNESNLNLGALSPCAPTNDEDDDDDTNVDCFDSNFELDS